MFSFTTIITLASFISSISAANFFASTTTHTNADAKSFCSTQGTHLLPVSLSNFGSVTASIGSQPHWIMSWNGDSYSNACLAIINGAIVPYDCNAQLLALCYKSN